MWSDEDGRQSKDKDLVAVEQQESPAGVLLFDQYLTSG